MNEAQIKTGTVWVYLGPGDGKNVRHKVTSVDNGEVTTWSEPSRNPEEGGQSWLGNINDREMNHVHEWHVVARYPGGWQDACVTCGEHRNVEESV